jgi:acyl-CoA synthetase (NDP forming)
LDRLLRPRSIAIVGASPRPQSFGQQLQQSLRSTGYAGRVLLVNPKYEQVEGLPCYPSLHELPEPPDCVAIAVGDSGVPAAMEDAARAAAGAAVLYGRLYDDGATGKSLPQRVAAIAREAGMQLCGGNCMGFINAEHRIQLTGYPFAQLPRSRALALVSHSGSTWSALVGNRRDLGFRYAISAGQELVTDAARYLEFLVEQPELRVICLVIETVRDPERFLAAMARAHAQGKVCIVLKLGRSSQGQEFAKSHSGALSSSAAVYDAVLERYGAVVVRSLDELMDTAEVFLGSRTPTLGALALGCDSGGERQLIADLSEHLDIAFAPLAPQTLSALRDILDPGIEPANPLDYWGDGRDVIADCMTVLAQDEGVGSVVVATNMPAGQDFTDTCVQAIAQTHARTDKPVIAVGNLGNSVSPQAAQTCRDLGVPVLLGTETALRALAHYSRYHDRAPDFTPPRPLAAAPGPLLQRFQQARDAGRPTFQDLQVLQDFGVAVPAQMLVPPAGEPQASALHALGFPLVAKIHDEGVAHKTELGGVVLGIGNEQDLTVALARLRGVHDGSIVLQQQLDGVEMILGMNLDPQFGQVFTIGFGGIFVEVMKDVALLLPTDSPQAILQRLQALRGFALLNGARGKPKADVPRLVHTIEAFMRACAGLGGLLSSLEINPLIVTDRGTYAVDLLGIFQTDSGASA